jgi:hypothetical protein
MEEVQPLSLFSLSIEPVTKAQLSEAARWARFLAIVGMIAVGLMVVGGVVYSIWLTSLMQSVQGTYGTEFPSRNYTNGLAIGSALMFAIAAIIIFFPFLYMLRFSNRMRTALNGNDQESLNASFQNLKIYFRYLGIITIIGLGLWVIWFVFVGIAVFAFS